ncbi:hypothetical protein, partial [Clostridium perfringens]
SCPLLSYLVIPSANFPNITQLKKSASLFHSFPLVFLFTAIVNLATAFPLPSINLSSGYFTNLTAKIILFILFPTFLL